MSSSVMPISNYYLTPPYINGYHDWEIYTLPTMPTNLENYIDTVGNINSIIASKFFFQLASAIGKLHSCGIIMAVLEMKDICIDIATKDITSIYLNSPCAIIYDPQFKKKAWVRKKRSMGVYAAPECKNEVGYDGFPADVYALGIIFYKMIVGCYPEYDSSSGIESSIKNLVSHANAPPHIIAMITLMLDTNPLVRPSIVNILNVKWVNDFMQEARVPIPVQCMTFPYFYCKPEYFMTDVPPYNKQKHFTFIPKTHEIEDNYSSAKQSMISAIENSLEFCKSYKKLKTECELAEKILTENVYKYLQFIQFDSYFKESTDLKSKIEYDRTQIVLMKHLISIRVKELDQVYNNICELRKYELICHWIVIFNRVNVRGYIFI
jgi:serine/threonine protein kinase